ncbi:hypothetical protein NBM05_11935 [Rothia sp. AR01]|uniref:Uncharacterized protein n=1 Tax=Rothia santali TaxID=2949643 RepID=A0A9X2HHK9_9MICC|nr:hypothetical protein [Rothia santali]MCP3426692.1 hypothetical protein [Rothia santali]
MPTETGMLAAWAGSTPSGIRAAEPASSRTVSASVPVPAAAAPKTRSPGAKASAPGPTPTTTPAASRPIAMGKRTGNPPCRCPERTLTSAGLTPAAVMRTRSWSGPGEGSSTVIIRATSGPPYSSYPRIRIMGPSNTRGGANTRGAAEVPRVVRGIRRRRAPG